MMTLAGIVVTPEAGVAAPVVAANRGIGRRGDRNTIAAFLAKAGIAGPVVAAKRGIGRDDRPQAIIPDTVPADAAKPVVAADIGIGRNHKRNATLAVLLKAGTAPPAIFNKYRVRRHNHAPAGPVPLQREAEGAFDFVPVDIPVGGRHEPRAGLAIPPEPRIHTHLLPVTMAFGGAFTVSHNPLSPKA